MTQAHDVAISDLRHTWLEDSDGYMVSDWEIATTWDAAGRPTQWRRLCTDRLEDTQTLSHILHAAAGAPQYMSSGA